VGEIRRKAFEELLEERYGSLQETIAGRLKIALMRGVLTGDRRADRKNEAALEMLRACENYGWTFALIWTVDRLYNSLIDTGFERRNGDLWHVLDTTMEDLKEFNWRDFLEEDACDDMMESCLRKMEEQVTSLEDLSAESAEGEESREKSPRGRIVTVDAEAASKMYSYIETNYGRSYLTPAESDYRTRRICKGIHADCLLYYTDGILADPVLVNAQYVRAQKHAADNRRAFLNHRNLIRRSVDAMSASLKEMLRLRTESELIEADCGTVIPNRLWRIGRTDPGKLFTRQTRTHSNGYAVSILMDASGSQHNRQSMVAIQAYIIAASLSRAGIAHEITGFCTFWDYTVLQRFRAYDAPAEDDRNVLNFMTSANNRDGLAVRAAGDSLLHRGEEGKILIMLSDGRPNDIIVNRPGSRSIEPYFGDFAAQDTAAQIRRLRAQGVSVLGVFTGLEKDLRAEQLIFGRDFAYIRDIRNFSRVVSSYLLRLLAQDLGEI